MMMVVVTVMIVVVVMPTRSRGLRSWFRALDRGRTHERIRAQHDTAADRFAGRGMLRQGRILDRLEDFETPHFLSGARQGFIDVGEHGEWNVMGPTE
jgi:hypothetical protein